MSTMAIISSKNDCAVNLNKPTKYLFYILMIFAVILALLLSLIILADYRDFQKEFNSDVERYQTQFHFYTKQNETVLEGLSAFVSGIGEADSETLDRYAKKIKAKTPHVYMLEVAEEVKKSDLKSFIEKKRYDGDIDFDIRAFDYSGKRKWRKLPQLDTYYPLVYLYPKPNIKDKILGLDLYSHPHLAAPLKRALSGGGFETSSPFNLIEGDKAFVMFKSVDLCTEGTPSCYVALIVITKAAFNFDMDNEDDSLGILLYHNSKDKSDRSGYFILRELKENKFLPQLVFTTKLKQDVGYVLQISKQFQLENISWGLLFMTFVIMLLSYYFVRYSLIKNQLMQDRLLVVLQNKSKMLAISELTGGIGHEFNNSLSVVRGYLSLLSDKNVNDAESLEWIENAEMASEKCIKLTRKLLTYSRYKGMSHPVSNIIISDYIAELKDELSRLLHSNVSLEYKLELNSAAVLISKDSFKEILFELVENANFAIADKGTIKILTETVHLTKAEDIGLENYIDLKVGDYIHLAVADNGSGIDDSIMSKILDPFFTTKDFGNSSGMGLASVYGLVKLNNGYISFSSKAGMDTVFDIYLPVFVE